MIGRRYVIEAVREDGRVYVRKFWLRTNARQMYWLWQDLITLDAAKSVRFTDRRAKK